MRNLVIVFGVSIFAIILITQSLYVVDETEQVVITRFGDVRSVERSPGLRVKLPFVDSVNRLDKRLLRIDADPEVMRDIDKENLAIDSYARYRVVDPVQFRKTLQTNDAARSRLGDIVNSTLREQVALRDRPGIIGSRPVLKPDGTQAEDEEGLPLFEGTESRSELLEAVLEGVRVRVLAQEQTEAFVVPASGKVGFTETLGSIALDADNADRDSDLTSGVTAGDIRVITGPETVDGVEGIDVVITDYHPISNSVTFGVQPGETLVAGDNFTVRYFAEREEPFGIEIVDVRIKRADFPDSVTPAIFTRMRAERNRIAARFRAEGDQEDLEIRASANKEREVILAEADRESNRVRGDGEAVAIRILADALGQDPEFFAFRRSLEAYQQVLNQGTTVILSADADLFRFLDTPGFESTELDP